MCKIFSTVKLFAVFAAFALIAYGFIASILPNTTSAQSLLRSSEQPNTTGNDYIKCYSALNESVAEEIGTLKGNERKEEVVRSPKRSFSGLYKTDEGNFLILPDPDKNRRWIIVAAESIYTFDFYSAREGNIGFKAPWPIVSKFKINLPHKRAIGFEYSVDRKGKTSLEPDMQIKNRCERKPEDCNTHSASEMLTPKNRKIVKGAIENRINEIIRQLSKESADHSRLDTFLEDLELCESIQSFKDLVRNKKEAFATQPRGNPSHNLSPKEKTKGQGL
jgi:hypothetical protein